MHRRAAPLEQAGGTAQERAGADRADAVRACSLTPQPIQHLFILHQRLLTGAARYVQHVELWRLCQYCIRRQKQPLPIPHRLGGLSVGSISGIRDAGQHLKRAGQVDLINTLKQERADLQVSVMGDHTRFLLSKNSRHAVAEQNCM
jgi:hypothetical protein